MLFQSLQEQQAQRTQAHLTSLSQMGPIREPWVTLRYEDIQVTALDVQILGEMLLYGHIPHVPAEVGPRQRGDFRESRIQ